MASKVSLVYDYGYYKVVFGTHPGFKNERLSNHQQHSVGLTNHY